MDQYPLHVTALRCVLYSALEALRDMSPSGFQKQSVPEYTYIVFFFFSVSCPFSFTGVPGDHLSNK